MMDLLREVAEPSRRMILAELKAGQRSVGELVALTGLRQPNVSNHLAKLRAKGIVRANKVGRQVFYALADPEVASTLTGLLTPGGESAIEGLELTSDTVKSFAKAAIAGDETTCTQIVDSFLRQNVPLVRLYHQLFSVTMDLIGKWYEVEAIDEGQEHLASAITERLMARVVHYGQVARPNGKVAVLGCSPGNWHSIGLRMLSDVMRLSGWRVYYLGANVPARSFLAAVAEHRPDVVMVSCPFEETVPDTLELIRQVKSISTRDQEFLIGVGGRPVTRDWKAFQEAGANFTAENLVHFAEELLPTLGNDSVTVNGHA